MTKIPGPCDSGRPRRSGTLYWLPLILDDVRLSPTETLLLVGLADHVNGDDECFVGIDRLASRSRCSYGTARRHLTALEAKGALARTRRRRSDGNLSVYDYRLLRSFYGEEPDRPPARDMRDDQRAPGCALTSARPGARAEPPRDEPPRDEQPLAPASETAVLPLGGMAPAPPPQEEPRTRRRDLLFEAVAEVCGIDWSRLTSAARGPLNRAVADLRSVEADPDEVAGRVAAYRRAFPDAALTPSALAKHWPALDPAIVNLPRSRPESINRQRSEFARAEALLAQSQEDDPIDPHRSPASPRTDDQSLAWHDQR